MTLLIWGIIIFLLLILGFVLGRSFGIPDQILGALAITLILLFALLVATGQLHAAPAGNEIPAPEPYPDEVTDAGETLGMGNMYAAIGQHIRFPIIHQAPGLTVAAANLQAVDASTDFGAFDPRAIPIEVQSWWTPAFGHIHTAVFFPLGQSVSGTVQFKVRVTMHHNPGQLFMLRVDDEQSTRIKVPLNLRCPTDICAWQFDVPFDSTKFPNGWRMIRWRAQVNTPDGKKFLTSSDLPLRIANGSGGSNALRFNSTDYMIGKGWYEGFDYTNAAIEHVPTKPVTGTLTLRVQTQKGGNSLIAELDKSHFIPAVGIWPEQGDSPGTVLLQTPAKVGQWFPVSIDTTTLANGWHSFQVRADTTRGEISKCSGCPNVMSHPAGVAKFWFFVAN